MDEEQEIIEDDEIIEAAEGFDGEDVDEGDGGAEPEPSKTATKKKRGCKSKPRICKKVDRCGRVRYFVKCGGKWKKVC